MPTFPSRFAIDTTATIQKDGRFFIAPLAEIRVETSAGDAAEIYDQAEGGTPLVAPVVTGSDGRFTIWLDRNAVSYTVVISFGGASTRYVHPSPIDANGIYDAVVAEIAPLAQAAAQALVDEIDFETLDSPSLNGVMSGDGLATPEQMVAGTAGKLVDAAQFRQNTMLTRIYTSPLIDLATGRDFVFAHGLGVNPKVITFVLREKNNNILRYVGSNAAAGGQTSRGFAARFDRINVVLNFANTDQLSFINAAGRNDFPNKSGYFLYFEAFA